MVQVVAHEDRTLLRILSVIKRWPRRMHSCISLRHKCFSSLNHSMYSLKLSMYSNQFSMSCLKFKLCSRNRINLVKIRNNHLRCLNASVVLIIFKESTEITVIPHFSMENLENIFRRGFTNTMPIVTIIIFKVRSCVSQILLERLCVWYI